MNSVFIVLHTRSGVDGAEDVKLIGAYSTKEAAEASVKDLKSKPGFSSFPDGFSVDEYQIDRTHWSEGFGEQAVQS